MTCSIKNYIHNIYQKIFKHFKNKFKYEVGDIIIVKMNSEDIVQLKVNEHVVRPFIVTKVIPKKQLVQGYYLSSKPNIIKNVPRQLQTSFEFEGMGKRGYVIYDVKPEIDFAKIKKIISKASIQTIEEIENKRNEVLEGRKQIIENKTISINSIYKGTIESLQFGDVIKVKGNRGPTLFMVKEINQVKEIIEGHYIKADNTKYDKIPKHLHVLVSKRESTIGRAFLIKYTTSGKIPFKDVYCPITSLSEHNIKTYHKRFNLFYKKQIFSDEKNILIEIGDIVKHQNQKYVIYQQDNTNSYGFPISSKLQDVFLNTINIDFKKHSVDFTNPIVLPNNTFLQICTMVSKDEIKKMLENKAKLKYIMKEIKKNNESKIKRLYKK